MCVYPEAFFSLLLVCCTVSGRHVNLNLVDLTHNFDNNSIYWPGSEPPTFIHKQVFRGYKEDPGFWYESNTFYAGEHGGTHIDAPAHFSQGRWRLEQIPIDRFFGPGVLIDISDRASTDPDAQVLVADVINNERKYGTIPDGAIVIFNTGQWKHYHNKTRYLGTDKNEVSSLHFPGIHPDTAQWLVDNRNIKGVGLDTPSLDYGQSKQFRTHQILFANNIYGIENIANLETLPARGSSIIALPTKIRDGSGGPIRMVAQLLPGTVSSSHTHTAVTFILVLGLLISFGMS